MVRDKRTFMKFKIHQQFYAVAKIHKIVTVNSYQLEWVTEGPNSSDRPATISKNLFTAPVLEAIKPLVEINTLAELMTNTSP